MLEEVKNYLRITWNDEDEEILRLIQRGKNNLDTLMGSDLKYKDNLEMDLLLNYCRYSRNNALEYFRDNFSDEIVNLQIDIATKEIDNDKEN